MSQQRRTSDVKSPDRRLQPSRPSPLHKTYSRRVPSPDQGWLSGWLTFFLGWPRPNRDPPE